MNGRKHLSLRLLASAGACVALALCATLALGASDALAAKRHAGARARQQPKRQVLAAFHDASRRNWGMLA